MYRKNELSVKYFDILPSTNKYLISLARNDDKLPEGTVIAAREQSAGRGRLGRSFFSPSESGLYMSVLLRPQNSDITFITPTAAVAVCKILEKYISDRCGIKWVNDIQINGKKVCGILTEGGNIGQQNAFAVVGIGINLLKPRDGFPDDIVNRAGYVFDTLPNGFFERLTEEIADELITLYHRGGDFEEYNSRLLTKNVDVRLINGDCERDAFALGINEKYHLIVRLSDGKEEETECGEATIRTK